MTKREKIINVYRQEIAKSMFELLEAGYEMSLSKNSIIVTELYKSKIRNRYYTEKVQECFCSGSYFDEAGLRLTMEKFRDYVRELIEVEKVDK